MTDTGVLAASDLRHAYRTDRGTVTALDGVSLSVHPGERVGIVGESGSGKSTLLRMLLALEAPDAGTVRYADRAIAPAGTRRLQWFRRRVQYIPQDPAGSLDPRRRVGALVTEPLRRLGVDGDHRARAVEVLAAVGLSAEFLDRRPGQLSGGQCQRVAIARALAPGAQVLLADEPVSGLDLPLRQQVLTVLGEVSERLGTAMVVVTHDLSVVSRLCDRCVVVTGGRIVEDRPTAALLAHPEHPYTQRLLAGIPRLVTA